MVKDQTNFTSMSRFTWNIQLAGYDLKKYDEKGETTCEDFLNEFDKFPWVEQMEKRNAMSHGCSPTLSVKDLETGFGFWVSIAGDKDNYGFLIGYIYPKEVKSFFGLGKAKTKRWCDIYLTENIPDIKNYFRLFFNKEYEQLENSIAKLDQFGSLEAGATKLIAGD
jgi:hypothetical protein